MKEKYTIEIADIQLNILSDEPEELVQATVAQLDQQVRDLTVKNKRCSKLDAALLCALDSLSERTKGEKRIRNLEAQISLYEATISRLNQTISQMKSTGIPKPVTPIREILREDSAGKSSAAETGNTPAREEKAAAQPASAQVPPSPVKPAETKPAEAKPTDTKQAESKAEDKPALHDAKLRQIEELLRRRSEEKPDSVKTDGTADASAETAGRDAKLREIEELLRKGGGNQSLSEALQDAIRS